MKDNFILETEAEVMTALSEGAWIMMGIANQHRLAKHDFLNFMDRTVETIKDRWPEYEVTRYPPKVRIGNHGCLIWQTCTGFTNSFDWERLWQGHEYDFFFRTEHSYFDPLAERFQRGPWHRAARRATRT